MITEINLNLIYVVFFTYTGILTSIIAYTNLFYNSPATNKFFVIRYGYIFILYIIIETIILYFQGYSFLIPVSILVLTFISLFILPDIFAKIKPPKFFTYLLLFWSYLVFFVYYLSLQMKVKYLIKCTLIELHFMLEFCLLYLL